MQETPTRRQMAAVIEDSGCVHIQDAIKAIREAGFSIEDLDDDIINSLIEVISSAEGVGAQAGRKRYK